MASSETNFRHRIGNFLQKDTILSHVDVNEKKNEPDESKDSPYKSFQDYSDALRLWMIQYQSWHQMNQMCMAMPYYYMGYNIGQQSMRQQRNLNQTESQPRRPANVRLPQVNRHRGITQNYRIPAIWKRVAAEFIDFFLLFAIKLGITILVIEYVGIIDFKKYDIDILFDSDIDYNAAFAMTSELVALEVINRIFITLFETMCLRKGMAGQIGGTSPGKRIMKLKVISCAEVQEMAHNRVRVLAAGDMGFWNALVRSVIKNFSLAFFFPVCFTAFFFQHNRAAYDIIANCIVVEEE